MNDPALTLRSSCSPSPLPAEAYLRDRSSPAPEHDARALTGKDGLAHIHLDGAVYTLRITRAGKLILTK